MSEKITHSCCLSYILLQLVFGRDTFSNSSSHWGSFKIYDPDIVEHRGTGSRSQLGWMGTSNRGTSVRLITLLMIAPVLRPI